MYHHFFHQSDPNWIGNLLTFFSVCVAGLSAYYAFKALRQSREAQVPILVPILNDVSDPHTLRFKIENIGNGLAKNIKVKIKPINQTVPFDSDLLPKKFADQVHQLGNWTTIAFNGGDNPLFNDGELFITYEDIFGNKFWMSATLKADETPARRALGHIDEQFRGIFYGPIS